MGRKKMSLWYNEDPIKMGDRVRDRESLWIRKL